MSTGFRVTRESVNPDGFTCLICDEAHDNEDSAYACCDRVIYTCAVCDETHDQEYDAQKCCDPVRVGSGEVIETYQCNWCHRKHLAQSPAEKCCPVRNYKCSGCGEKFTIEQFDSKDICSCERSTHQVILF